MANNTGKPINDHFYCFNLKPCNSTITGLKILAL